MNETNSNIGGLPKQGSSSNVGPRDASAWDTNAQARQRPSQQYSVPPGGLNGHVAAPFTPWPILEAVLRKWYWLMFGALLLGAVGFAAGITLWHTRYTASAQLLRFDTPNNSEFFKPRPLAEQTFASMLRSPELLKQVSLLTKPALSPDRLASSLIIIPERNSDIVTISITALDPKLAINTANLFANQAVEFSKRLQVKEAEAASIYYTNQLAEMNRDRATLVTEMQRTAREAARPVVRSEQLTDKFQVSLAEKIQTAKEELVNLLSKYTQMHPAVKEQESKISALQQQLEALATNTTAKSEQPVIAAPPRQLGTNSPALTGKESDFEILRTQLQTVEGAHSQLLARQREALLFKENPPGYCQLFAPATQKAMVVRDRWPKIIILSVFAALVGFFSCGLLLVGIEFLDQRVKTAVDVQRVTQLPLLATLGDLRRLDQSSQENWAFRTWTALQSRLSLSPNHGLVCGFTSAERKEGRTTWIGLLANAAGQCGFRVLTIAALPDSESAREEPQENQWEENAEMNPNGHALTTNVLSTPALVTEKLIGGDPQPLVHIPLPGWVWDLERRKQWQTALREWSRIENIVILVELPPASVPESVLLAENLPNLVWLSRSGAAKASQSRLHLETLRLARCNLVGAVLNREKNPPIRNRFQRWFGCAALLFGLSLSCAQAAEGDLVPAPAGDAVVAAAPVPQTNLSFSVIGPANRAGWQQRLTLGPGDVLNLSLFGQPDLKTSDVFVGPDGRISFLQAQDIVATGLTVDELRAKLDEELAKYYRAPRTIITPVSFHSKKYYVLGKVNTRGVFTLERPLTIVEAVARAKGLETSLLPDNRNLVDLADLQKSFLVRQGKRVTVDFERLFHDGDLSQNIALEPEDYLYFAAGNVQQVYVLGEVQVPGPMAYTENLTVVGAIAGRAGFTQRAYKSRVLVIRGSLNHPQTFVVDVWKVTEGKALDFRLRPKDIVYVNYRPFIRAEELVDLGITAFIQASVAEFSGLHVLNPFH